MNIIEEIRAFRAIVLGKQDKLVPGDHIILGDDDVISVDFGPVDALLDRLEEVEDDVNALNFNVTELDIRLDAAEENIDDAQDHLDSIDDSIDVLSSDLEALGQKVDNIHGFEIIALGEGQYDPTTRKPTIQNPKTNTLYLVPNDDPTQRNLWIEWLWLSGRWEQFGTAVIDLSEYVMKTDLPTTTTTGVVKVNRLNGVQLLTNGQLAITPASIGDISSGQSETLPITPYQQHNAVFYGLARAARTPALYYSAPDKTNIRLMLDAGSHAQVEELAEQVEGYGISVAQLLNTDKTTPAGMVWESKEYGAGWSEAAQGKVVDVLKDGESLMDEHGIVELPDVDIPTKTSDLVNDSGFITESSLPTKVSDLENDSGFLVSSDLASYALISDLPTKVSDLQNDSGFLTEVPLATTTTLGGIRLTTTYGFNYTSDGSLFANTINYEAYANKSTGLVIGKGTLENVLNGRGYPVDIRINGASIINENKVANLPMANNQLGLVWVRSDTQTGIQITGDGKISTKLATNKDLSNRNQYSNRPIAPPNFDYAVKIALTDGIGPEYTSEEQAAARARLGITAGEKEIFEATYGTTTYDEIAEAVEDGKTVVMKYNAYVYSLSVFSNAIATFNSLDAAKMRYACVQPGETSVWHSGTDNLQYNNLSQTIEGQETSTTKYPTTKAVVDYVGSSIDGLVDDVKINGTSIVDENKVANIPIGSGAAVGLLKTTLSYGTQTTSDGSIAVYCANDNAVKTGDHGYRPVPPKWQHYATFYGLAKAAGHDEKDSTLEFGTYSDDAKTAIKNMLGITEGGLVDDVKINGTSIVDENKVANIPLAGNGVPGVPGLVRVWGTDYRTGIKVTSMDGASNIIMTVPATEQLITQRSGGQVITPTVLDIAVKAALTDGVGPDYTTAEQSAARTRFGAASETDLEALSRRVDALHGFEIVFLTTGEYDPETGIPTILGPQEGTLYLVPSGQEAPDVWTEWLWTGEAWEKFGSSSIDLSNYVQKTDYANASTGGVILVDPSYGLQMTANGKLNAVRRSYTDYQVSNNNFVVGKGTLENVLAARIPDVPSISYDETEEMLVWQTTADDGNEVSY